MTDLTGTTPERLQPPPLPPGRPRRRGVAILLSLLLAGLGELYAGRPRAAVVTFVSVGFLGPLILALMFLSVEGLWILILPCGILLGALVFVLVRAARAARAAPNPYALQPYNRWYWYALAVLIFQFVWQPAVFNDLRSGWLEAFRLPSNSMEPTLHVGDFIFVSKRPAARIPQLNGLVVFSKDGLMVLKRVVGLAGDTLAMKDGRLFRNGRALTEPYAQNVDPVAAERGALEEGRPWHLKHLVASALKTEEPYHPDMRNWGPLVIPPDSVFVLGDNRDNSYDSRFFGAIGVNRIRGRPLVIYFSAGLGPAGGGVQWSRIGLRL